MITIIFANLIKKERKRQKLSQQELATKAGVSRMALSFWELGKREPSLESANKILSALGISMSVGKEELE